MGAFSELSPAQQVATGCRVLGATDSGDAVWGHVSMRDPEGGTWIKAGPAGFDEVTERDVVLVGDDGEAVDGSFPVPWEAPLHTEILRARSDVGSVVHTHPPHAIALAAAGQPVRSFSNAAGLFADGVPRYERPVALIDSTELGAEVAACLGERPALLLVGHGVVTVGTSVATAVTAAVLLERACRLQILASAAGGVDPVFTLPKSRYAHAQADAYLLRSWEYFLRAVDRAATGVS